MLYLDILCKEKMNKAETSAGGGQPSYKQTPWLRVQEPEITIDVIYSSASFCARDYWFIFIIFICFCLFLTYIYLYYIMVFIKVLLFESFLWGRHQQQPSFLGEVTGCESLFNKWLNLNFNPESPTEELLLKLLLLSVPLLIPVHEAVREVLQKFILVDEGSWHWPYRVSCNVHKTGQRTKRK